MFARAGKPLRKHHAAGIAVALTLVAGISVSAQAQIVNGDFASGGTGWTVSIPPGWFVAFSDIQNQPGICRISDPDTTGGIGCIRQTFVCGTSGARDSCAIDLDYAFVDITPDAPWRLAKAAGFGARIKVFIDGTLVRTFEAGECDPSGELCRAPMFSVACGEHEIAICSEVDLGYREIYVDNVTAQCGSATPVRPMTWGRVKILHR